MHIFARGSGVDTAVGILVSKSRRISQTADPSHFRDIRPHGVFRNVRVRILRERYRLAHIVEFKRRIGRLRADGAVSGVVLHVSHDDVSRQRRVGGSAV